MATLLEINLFPFFIDSSILEVVHGEADHERHDEKSNMNTSGNTSAFNRALERYAQALGRLEREGSPQMADILEVLVARDAVQAVLSMHAEQETSHLARLVELDVALKQEGANMAITTDLDALQAAVNPPPEAWWWSIRPPPVVDRWDHFDWAWNLIALALLAGAAAFMKSLYAAFSVGSLTTAQTLSTIAQGAGLALIGGGALTDTGRDRIQGLLRAFGVPPRFHRESTCVFALVFLIIMYTTKGWMKEKYEQSGTQHYQQGHLSDAADDFLRVLALDPGNERAHIALGDVYASLGNYDQALEQYWQGVEDDPYGFNEIGLTYIQRFNPMKKRTEPVLAETFLRMALQRAIAQGFEHPNEIEFVGDSWEKRRRRANTIFQIYRNLGWALLNQKRYDEAKVHLGKAINVNQKMSKSVSEESFVTNTESSFHKSIGNTMKNIISTLGCYIHTDSYLITECPANQQDNKRTENKENKYEKDIRIDNFVQQIGSGMEHCFLAQVYTEQWKLYQKKDEQNNQTEAENKAREQWNHCKKEARPETVGEYKWFLDVGQAAFANCIDTSSIVTLKGSDSKYWHEFKEDCELKLPWTSEAGDAAKASALRTRLHDRIEARWSGHPLAYPNAVVYRLRVTADGTIVGYDPQGEAAKVYADKTPLPHLVAPFERFKVVFKPEGAFDVIPEQ